MSNIQVLVHLFLSKSLLIIIDEFQRIVCIVSNIFFIIFSCCIPLHVSRLVICFHFSLKSFKLSFCNGKLSYNDNSLIIPEYEKTRKLTIIAFFYSVPFTAVDSLFLFLNNH